MRDVAAELAGSLGLGEWTEWADLPDGGRVRAKVESDHDSSLNDGDWFGQIVYPDRYSRTRPEGCDGAARKIETRGGTVWWQPARDVLSDPVALASLERRVRGYYLEHWSYCGIVVETESPPCPHCGERKSETASLWGIEDDAGREYFAEVVGDLMHMSIPA